MAAIKNKAAPAAQPVTVPTPRAFAPMTLALQEFSAELAQRLPRRFVRRFVMPSTIRDCAEVFILELNSREELDAAVYADATMTGIERASVKLTNEAEQKEAVRLSIVGIGEMIDGVVVYRHTNNEGIPLAEANDWARKTWICLHSYFSQVNGVPTEELAEGILGARTVGAFAPPTSGIPASAADGR